MIFMILEGNYSLGFVNLAVSLRISFCVIFSYQNILPFTLFVLNVKYFRIEKCLGLTYFLNLDSARIEKEFDFKYLFKKTKI